MAKAPKIETCFDRIEAIVAALEDGDLALDEALARYEQGLTAIAQARRILSSYQARIEELRAGAEEQVPADGDAAAAEDADGDAVDDR